MRRAWTAKRIILLRRLWAEGATAQAIAAEIGGMSRSAVLGQVFRLRRAARAATAASAAPDKDPAAMVLSPVRRRRRVEKTETPAPPPPPLSPPHKTLFELTNTSCRWPHGRPGARNFFFCGEPEADLERGIPYCAQHMRRAYNVLPDSFIEKATEAAT